MKDLILQLFGEGRDLEWYQMCVRGLLMFLITLALVRISGRRSFGMKTPFDNIITLLLGAILSRGVVGVSPFFSVCAAGLVIVLAHRLLAWAMVHSKKIARLVHGRPILLFKDGAMQNKNMDRSLVCEEELLERIRLRANAGSLKKWTKLGWRLMERSV